MEKVIGFKTEKGSKYLLNEKGQTQRYKEATGNMETPYDMCFFIDEEKAEILASVIYGENESLNIKILGIDKNKKSVQIRSQEELRNADPNSLAIGIYDDTKKNFTRIVRIDSLTPEEGLQPFEICYKTEEGRKHIHLGHAIVRIYEKYRDNIGGIIKK